MLIVIALGGNALLQRGEPMEAELQHKNVKNTAAIIARLAKDHQIVVCHGNGPQVGLLALQAASYTKIKPYPLDVLGAQTQGMIGYLIQQEVANKLPDRQVVTLLSQVLVSADDPAFTKPTKPIGPVYSEEQAKELAALRGWQIGADGKHFRRVVASPKPQELIELEIVKALLKLNTLVICGGGGGIPVIRDNNQQLVGVEAVIDKDKTSALIAQELKADALLILTDVTAVCENFGTPEQKMIQEASPQVFKSMSFASGSMGPKIEAACQFVENTHKFAVIGNLFEIDKMLIGKAGTRVINHSSKLVYYPK